MLEPQTQPPPHYEPEPTDEELLEYAVEVLARLEAEQTSNEATEISAPVT